jgi:hypothetical protein
MVALTLRSVKGSALTHQEVDDNFTGLDTGKTDVGHVHAIADITGLDAALAAYGTATIDFGAFPGSNEASVAFADPDIGATAKVDAFVMAGDTTADHTAADHRYAGQLFSLSAAPSAGVGGTIYARSIHKLQGTFAVRWRWAA